jgi:hypothetical protein
MGNSPSNTFQLVSEMHYRPPATAGPKPERREKTVRLVDVVSDPEPDLPPLPPQPADGPPATPSADPEPAPVEAPTPVPEPEPEITETTETPQILPTTDTVVNSVLLKFITRSHLGLHKYGTSLDRTDLHRVDWLNHLQEELMDAILYLERLKRDL